MNERSRPAGNGPANDSLSDSLDLTAAAPREPSAWLRHAEGRRLAEIDAAGLTSNHGVTVVAPLGHSGRPGDREDRTCDRCRRYAPVGEAFHPFIARPRPWVALIGGFCTGCARRERGNDA